jgi:hypothetical protein
LSEASTNNTLYFWDGLIEHLRFPFLKTILPRHNKPWHNSMTHLRDFIEQHTTYPYGLIESNVERLGFGSSSWVKIRVQSEASPVDLHPRPTGGGIT